MSDAVAGVIPASHADLLETAALAHVATVGPRGEPQNNPVWFDWDAERLRFSQTTTRQKYRNLRRDPRVAVSIVDPANPYRYLELRGAVERIDPDPDLAFADKVSRKYLGVGTDPTRNPPWEERVVVVVRPERVTTMG